MWIFRFDPELMDVYRRLFIGIGVKTFGYLIIAAGIFLSIKNKDLACKTIYVGISLVVLGWLLIYQALKMAGTKKVKHYI